MPLYLLYSPILISIHDYWKNRSFDYTDICLQSALPDGAGLRSNTTQTRYTPQWQRDIKLEGLFPNMQKDLKSKLSPGVQYYYKVKIKPVSDLYMKDASTGKYGWVEDFGYESGLRSFTYKAP